MKVFIVKRLGGFEADTEPFCDVWVGLTREAAIKKAVDCMYDWWHDQYGSDGEPPSDERVFCAYVDFWHNEELITILEEEI